MVAESSDTATIKKLHVSSANLQRVSNAGLLTYYFAFLVRVICDIIVLKSEPLFNPLPHGDANRHTIFKRKN